MHSAGDKPGGLEREAGGGAYARQQEAEQVFRRLKNGGRVGWALMHHWTGCSILPHAFTCMLGLSLLHQVRCKTEAGCPELSMEALKCELEGNPAGRAAVQAGRGEGAGRDGDDRVQTEAGLARS